MGLKVVVIGGGSSYTPEIIEGLIQRQEQFPVTDIVLVDVEEGKRKLETIGRLGKRMIEKADVSIQLSWTMDRRKALEGADFVSTQIRVGGLDARMKDELIPLKHGYIGQETNGAGGIMKAFRTIPVLMELAEEVQNICPEAWIINFTNPAGIVTEALLKHSPHKKIIGVCNVPFNMRHSTAEMLQAEPEDVQIDFVGMNHFVFGRRVYVKGVDVTKEVMTKLSEGSLDYSPANIINLGWSRTFIEAMQLLPNPYHQYYFQTAEVLRKDKEGLRDKGTRAEQVMELEKSLFSIYEDPGLNKKPEELGERGGAFYSEVACNLMDSLYNDRSDIQTVNTLNKGAVPELPYDSVVEVNAVITSHGPVPLSTEGIPIEVRGIMHQMKAFEELTIQAAISGTYHDAYRAFLMNPLIMHEGDSKVLLDELLKVHRDHLPQFSKEEGSIDE
ncbi:6-phospho-beta-glucosidase [Salinicoccus carnicancri]|uniref:6-phospho-beta-glucosidase n=1 Tax=Salinicoccus carnicancri TaxID=558170 RepID=UPI0002D7DD17|nr:6-phospho-beta-glucosidase [Salinicoccus carnicancri]